MEPEDIEQLQKDIKQIKDIVTRDHHMMGVLYRYHRWSRAYALLKILVIAGIVLGAYYYIEPLIAPAVNVYDKVTNNPLLNASSSASGIMKYFK
ncbi:MAG: hypothetical protein WCO16_02440 [bacterium]